MWINLAEPRQAHGCTSGPPCSPSKHTRHLSSSSSSSPSSFVLLVVGAEQSAEPCCCDTVLVVLVPVAVRHVVVVAVVVVATLSFVPATHTADNNRELTRGCLLRNVENK